MTGNGGLERFPQHAQRNVTTDHNARIIFTGTPNKQGCSRDAGVVTSRLRCDAVTMGRTPGAQRRSVGSKYRRRIGPGARDRAAHSTNPTHVPCVTARSSPAGSLKAIGDFPIQVGDTARKLGA